MSSRPRRLVVGEEALVRRRRRRRRAAALVVAEHAAASFLGLAWNACCAALGAAPLRECAGPWTSDAIPQRLPASGPGRARCASPCQCCPGACPGWAPCGRRGTEAAGTPRRRPDDSPERSRAGSRLGSGVRVPSSGTKRRAVNWQEAHRSARRTERTHRADSSAAPDASQRCPGRPRLAGARARAAPPKGLSALQPTAAATDH